MSAAANPRSSRTVLASSSGGQRAALELRGHRAAELAQHVTVVLGPRELLPVVDAEDADARARGFDRGAETAGRPPRRGPRRPGNVPLGSASAGGRRGAPARGDLHVREERYLRDAAPSSRALSAASRSSASPGASASRRRAASIRWRVRLTRARTSAPSRTLSLSLCSARRAASSSGSEPTRRSNGPTTAQTAFSRSRARRRPAHPGLRPQLRGRRRAADPAGERDADVPGSSHAANARLLQCGIVARERPDPPHSPEMIRCSDSCENAEG